ncbi:MAG: HD family phosphohydrolase [Salibacteraceae bacterium]
MNEFINRIRHSQDLIFKAFVLIAALGIIVYLMPKEAKFKYEFQKGKPWLHENLYAAYDFAILKSNEDLDQEEEQIIENSLLFFAFDQGVKEKSLSDFNQKILRQLDTLKTKEHKKYLEIIPQATEILNSIYDKGLVQPVEDQEDLKPTDLIALNFENEIIEKEYGDFYTIRSASSYAVEKSRELKKEYSDILQDIVLSNLTHNVLYDEATTQKVLESRLNKLSKTKGKVEKDQLIISKGQVITDDLWLQLESLKSEYELRQGGEKSFYYIAIGQILLVGMVMLVMVLFLSIFRQHILNVNNRVLFIVVSFTLTVLMGMIPIYFEQVPIYALPFCILPILIKSFYDEIMASYIHVLAMILIGFVAPNGFEFVFLQSIAGLIAVFSLVSLRKRSQLLATVLIIFLTYSISELSILINQEGNFENLRYESFYWFAASAVLTLLVYPMIYLYEKIFGFLSDVTLMEIADTNSPLLRDLATKAPGTFQHSLQVANLAERAILKVGGNPLLVRTGALYHDIGKMAAPHFFIENQVGGINPHDEIDADESAKIIINHVIKGIEMAKKHNLPEVIIDFLRTHHGTSKVKYFLYKYKEENPGKEIDTSLFTYPGPIPFSKETAVLMMADACEAASRSLKEYNEESIGKLVTGIVDSQADDQQFANADITYKDITIIKKIFIGMLLNIYHVRIAYPKG